MPTAPTLPDIERLNQKAFNDVLAANGGGSSYMPMGDNGDHELLPPFVIAAYRLPRGSVFRVADVPHPVAGQVTVGSQRTFMVLARELGDVKWPAYLLHMTRDSPGRAIAVVRRGYSRARLKGMQTSILAWVGLGDNDEDGGDT